MSYSFFIKEISQEQVEWLKAYLGPEISNKYAWYSQGQKWSLEAIYYIESTDGIQIRKKWKITVPDEKTAMCFKLCNPN
jgi:hypothetical protein